MPKSCAFSMGVGAWKLLLGLRRCIETLPLKFAPPYRIEYVAAIYKTIGTMAFIGPHFKTSLYEVFAAIVEHPILDIERVLP